MTCLAPPPTPCSGVDSGAFVDLLWKLSINFDSRTIYPRNDLEKIKET